MKKDIRLIAVDLDNTLLRRDKSISDFTKSVFTQCREKGIVIAFATARSEKASEQFMRQIVPDVIISNSGALARRGAETLYLASIPNVTAQKLVHYCVGSPEILQITLDSGNGYFNSLKFDSDSANPSHDYSHAITIDFAEQIDFGDVYKIVVRADDRQVMRNIAAFFPSVGVLSFTEDKVWHMLHSPAATKGQALCAVADALNISIENVVAFGDDINDIEMLQNAGAGVAMSNAIEDVAAVADYICGDCDEDGVANWLAANVL